MVQSGDGRFLLAQRPVDKVYAGYWEFPGGKIEPGEAAAAALARELHEELAIEVKQSYPWITRDYDYAHAAVRLRFFRVTDWAGEIHGRENQAFAWQEPGRVSVAPVLPANGPILAALTLPVLYGVSNAAQTGADVFLQRLERALARGLRLVQIREPVLGATELERLTARTLAITRGYGARVLLNAPPERALQLGADGVHLTAERLLACRERPPCPLVAASCHDAHELAQAAKIGADFVVLGAVRETATHPDTAGIGWSRFSQLIRDYPLPVFAIGGLGPCDYREAWAAGAHGIAAIRAAWRDASD